jgi:hypothetical protein
MVLVVSVAGRNGERTNVIGARRNRLDEDGVHKYAYPASRFACLFESVICPLFGHGLPDPIKPARPDIDLMVKFWNIRLNVEKGGTVQDVHILDMQSAVLYPLQLDNGKADRIRPFGCSCGENPARLGIHERDDLQVESLAAVEMVEEDDMGKPIEILQPGSVFFKDFDGPFHTAGTRRLDRHARRVGEWRIDRSYGVDFHSLLKRLPAAT